MCALPGCTNMSIFKRRLKSGKKAYGKLCQRHHRLKYNMTKRRSGLPCQLCGWDKSYCDTHRILSGKDGGTYEKHNIMVLCPNCHRLQHFPTKINDTIVVVN